MRTCGDRNHRAQCCLVGQIAGDGLGSLVGFQSREDIRCCYLNDVRDLADGGTWNTMAGQPTAPHALLQVKDIVALTKSRAT